MPTYPHSCELCEITWDVVARVDDRNDPSPCPNCKTNGVRQVTRANFNGAADWNTQTYNPGLGCYTRNNLHARQIAKSRGCEEIGNEPVEKVHKYYENKNKEIKEQRWRDADRQKVYE